MKFFTIILTSLMFISCGSSSSDLGFGKGRRGQQANQRGIDPVEPIKNPVQNLTIPEKNAVKEDTETVEDIGIDFSIFEEELEEEEEKTAEPEKKKEIAVHKEEMITIAKFFEIPKSDAGIYHQASMLGHVVAPLIGTILTTKLITAKIASQGKSKIKGRKTMIFGILLASAATGAAQILYHETKDKVDSKENIIEEFRNNFDTDAVSPSKISERIGAMLSLDFSKRKKVEDNYIEYIFESARKQFDAEKNADGFNIDLADAVVKSVDGVAEEKRVSALKKMIGSMKEAGSKQKLNKTDDALVASRKSLKQLDSYLKEIEGREKLTAEFRQLAKSSREKLAKRLKVHKILAELREL